MALPSKRSRPAPAGLLVAALLASWAQGCAVARPFPSQALIDAALQPPPPYEASPPPELAERIPEVQRRVEDIGHLTYDDAALVALAVNPALREARAQRGIAQAQLIQAGILPNPQLTGSLDVPTDGATRGTNPGYSVELAWELKPLLAVGAAIGAERKGLEAVDLDIAWKEWQVAAAARLGVVRLAMLSQRIRLARETQAEMATQAELLRTAVDHGDATALELAAAQSSLQAASLASLHLDQAQRSARLEWLNALGLPPTSEVGLADDPRLPRSEPPPALPSLLSRLPSSRLDLVGVRRAYKAEDGRARAEALRAFPSLTLSVWRTLDTANLRTVGGLVTIDLPLFDRNQGAIEAATATRDQLQQRYEADLQAARSQVASAHADLISVREQRTLVASWVPTLEALVSASEGLVGTGNVTVVELYDLRVRLLDARLLLEELHQQELELAVALELSSGVPWTQTRDRSP